MKTAYTVEEYTACHNTVIVVEHTEPVWEKHVVQTTEKLLDKLRELDGKSISVSYCKSQEFTHPYRRCKSNSRDPSKQSGFYVLRADNGYFSKRSTRRISFDFTVALRDLALQQSDPTQCVFLFGRKLNGRQPGLAFSVDTG